MVTLYSVAISNKYGVTDIKIFKTQKEMERFINDSIEELGSMERFRYHKVKQGINEILFTDSIGMDTITFSWFRNVVEMENGNEER